jgi:hypothetical protein
MEYRQVVRQRFLISLYKGSNPFIPKMLIVQLDRTLDYESKC